MKWGSVYTVQSEVARFVHHDLVLDWGESEIFFIPKIKMIIPTLMMGNPAKKKIAD